MKQAENYPYNKVNHFLQDGVSHSSKEGLKASQRGVFMLTISLFPPQSLLHDPVGSTQELAWHKVMLRPYSQLENQESHSSGMCLVLLLIENQVLALQELGFLPKQKANKNLLHSLLPLLASHNWPGKCE